MQFIAPSRPNIPRQHVLKLRSRFLHHVLLKLKHPEAKSVDLSTIVSSNSLPCDPRPVIYEQITGPLVPSVALKTAKEQPAHQASTPKDGDSDASAPLRFNIKISCSYNIEFLHER